MKEVCSKRQFLTFNRIRYLPTDGKKTIFDVLCPFYTVIRHKLYLPHHQQRFLPCFWDPIQESKANSSHIRRNSTQSPSLRCQGKRQALRA